MPALTITNVGDILRKFNATYQPKGVCAATPAKMKLLLDQLEEYTDEVQWARNKYKALGVASIALGPTGIAVSELLGGGDVDVAQWRRDMANWQYRLAEYQRVLDNIPSDRMNTAEGCREIYPLVTAPLLDGIWYEVLPGVVLSNEEKQRIREGTRHCPEGVETCTDIAYRDPETGDHPPGHSNPKPPDAITPFSLGNQIVVYQDFQKENAERFFDDLLEGARKFVDPGEWPWWLTAAIIAGAGVGVGLLGLYVYQFLPDAPKANPRRRSTRKPSLTADQRRVLDAVASAGGWESTETLYDLVGPGDDEDDPYEDARAAVGGLERKGLLKDRPSQAAMGAVELTAKGRKMVKESA